MNKDDLKEIQEEKALEETSFKKNQDHFSEIKLPVLRESRLPELMPLTQVFVSFPTARSSLISKIMYYKIEFEWNNEKKQIQRRYSDFENLREALVSLLPFNFIFPVHRKQFFVF